MLSLDEFVAIIRNVRPHGFATEAVRMFREAVLLSEARTRSRFNGGTATGAFCCRFMCVCLCVCLPMCVCVCVCVRVCVGAVSGSARC